MKINKKAIDSLLMLDDDKLWSTIQLVATQTGNTNIKNIKRPDDLTQLRKTLSTLASVDISNAAEIVEKGLKNE